MKKTILLFFLCSLSLFGQDSLQTPPKWNISVTMGIQQHDKRLYNYPQRQSLFDKHSGFFGTYQLAIRADKTIFEKRLLELTLGGGIGTELNTFTRPFDKSYKKNDGLALVLLSTNRYYKNVFQLPITTYVSLNESIKLGIEVLPQFTFLTIAHNSAYDLLEPTTWWGFNFHSIEMNPSLLWIGEKFDFGLKYRLIQVKRIDPIIFNRLIRDPRTDQNFELNNPFKLWFSVGCHL